MLSNKEIVCPVNLLMPSAFKDIMIMCLRRSNRLILIGVACVFKSNIQQSSVLSFLSVTESSEGIGVRASVWHSEI